MWHLYYAPGTVALASHIALEEAGAEFTAHRLDFRATQQQTRDYLAINPKGRVPALITERGTLTETPAILAFIAQTFPAAGLAPLDDPFAFARMQEFNSYLASTLHVNHAHKIRGARWADDEAAWEAMKKRVPETMAASCAHIEEWYLGGRFVMGDSYSVADAYLFTVSGWLEGDNVDLDRFPKVRDHRAMMAERPAVQRALATQTS